MTYLLNQAFQIVLMVIFLLVFILLLLIGFFVMNSIKRKNRKDVDSYYQNLDRYDAQDFLDDLEDIVDEMVVMTGHRRFIAAIKCSGFDLATASSSQRVAAFQGYHAFINTITQPITYRQYYVPMSMDYTKNKYAARYEEMERELFHKNEDRKVLLERLNTVKGIDIMEEEALIANIEKLQEEMDNLEWRRLHMKEQIDFMNAVCDEKSLEPSREEAYLISWEYIPSEYSVEMSEEEIHKKAILELTNRCNGMIGTLAGCNVHAYRCTTEELIEIFYQHSHPLSSVEFKMANVMNSPYFEDVITTNDLDRMKDIAYQEVMLTEGEEMIERVADVISGSASVEKGEGVSEAV